MVYEIWTIKKLNEKCKKSGRSIRVKRGKLIGFKGGD